MGQISNKKAARKSGTSLRCGLIDFVLVPILVSHGVDYLLCGVAAIALKRILVFAWRKRTEIWAFIKARLAEIWAFIKPWLNDDGPPNPPSGAPALATC